MREKIKARIIGALNGAGLGGLSTTEVAHRAKINRITAAEYLRAMADQGDVITIPKPPLNLHVLNKNAGASA